MTNPRLLPIPVTMPPPRATETTRGDRHGPHYPWSLSALPTGTTIGAPPFATSTSA